MKYSRLLNFIALCRKEVGGGGSLVIVQSTALNKCILFPLKYTSRPNGSMGLG